ncbi:MAG: DUF3515 family protein [Pseudonocardiales bacterium]|nr:DUF3515 family protein [Pseudonocardiales bacterium]
MSTRRGFLDRNAWLAWAMLIALSIGMLVGLFSLIVWLLGRPVELAPVNAPDAASPACQQLTAALPAELPSHEDNGYGGDMGPLRRAALANPAPAAPKARSCCAAGCPGRPSSTRPRRWWRSTG